MIVKRKHEVVRAS